MSKGRREGTRVGGWQLQRLLGSGGNGEVYLSEKEGQQAAVKILHPKSSRKRIARFRDEIEAMRRCKELGCIPVLEFDIPDALSNSNPAWFAMSVAEPLESALGKEPPLADAVSSIRDIARLLVEMHSIGIAHRDIKPDNLFKYEGQWTVGDFGLAEYEGKLARTEEGERIGPVFFIAPEMLNDAIESDGKAADVYSLAKTLWILITGQTFPLPGTMYKSVDALRASNYHTDVRAPLLDPIIELATNLDADKRPAMEAFADELEEWLNPTMKSTTDSEIDLSEFAASLAVPKYQLEAAMDANQANQTRINATGTRIREKLRPLFRDLEQQLKNANFLGASGNVDNIMWGGDLRATVPRPDSSKGFARLHLGVVCNYEDAASAKLTATYFVEVDNKQPAEVWTTSVAFLPESSSEEAEFGRFVAEIRSQFRPVVKQVLEANSLLG